MTDHHIFGIRLQMHVIIPYLTEVTCCIENIVSSNTTLYSQKTLRVSD